MGFGEAERRLSIGEDTKTSQTLFEDASQIATGFAKRAEDALNHPAQTLGSLAISSFVGQSVVYCRNNPELAGSVGRLFGRCAPTGLLAIAVGDLIYGVATSNDSDEALQHLGARTFDIALGGATAFGTYKIANSPRLSNLFGPQPMTEVPKGLKFNVADDIVRIRQMPSEPDFQVRLANGKGFKVNQTTGETEVQLRPMPTKLEDGTKLDYFHTSTTVTKPDGICFRQHLDGSIEQKMGDLMVRKFNNGFIRTVSDDGDLTLYRGTEWLRTTSKGDKIWFDTRSGTTTMYDAKGWSFKWKGDALVDIVPKRGSNLMESHIIRRTIIPPPPDLTNMATPMPSGF